MLQPIISVTLVFLYIGYKLLFFSCSLHCMGDIYAFTRIFHKEISSLLSLSLPHDSVSQCMAHTHTHTMCLGILYNFNCGFNLVFNFVNIK
jgi:hypothetical protein